MPQDFEVVSDTPNALSVVQPDKWERLMQLAIERGGSAEQFAMLVDAMLKARAEDARLQYHRAMREFKKSLPEIIKTKHVRVELKGGGTMEYDHPELEKASAIIAEELNRHGLDHSWKPSEGANGRIVVTCVFHHRDSGHSEEVATLGGPPDTSGTKNGVQAIGSTTSYLQRYSLLAGAGIVPKGVDNDGQTSESNPFDPITESVVAKHVNNILAAGNDAVLKSAYLEALNEAQAVKDEAAQKQYSKAKNQRWREIHEKAAK